jgi:hypothetical protein
MTQQIAGSLGIGTSTVYHKQLKGSESKVGNNTIYTGPGPLVSFSAQYAATYTTYWVGQEFLRAEQRQDDFTLGVVSDPMLQSQIPVLDTGLNIMVIAQDDFIQDAAGNLWRIVNPTLSSETGYWAFMASRQR